MEANSGHALENRKEHTLTVIARILDEVCLQHAHQDGGQEAGQQQHGHARVDDGEPVDLHPKDCECSTLKACHTHEEDAELN